MDKTMQLRVIAAMQDRLSGPLNKVRGSAGPAARGVAELRDKLKALSAAQRDVGRFGDLTRDLQSTRTQLAAAQQRVAALAQQMRAVEAPTRDMQREFNGAVRAAQQLKAQAGGQAIELQRLRSSLSGAGISTANLVQHERELRQSIATTNQALDRQTARLKATAMQQERMARARQALDRGRNVAMGAAAAGAGGLGAGFTLAQPLKAIVNAFAPAEDAATQLRVSLMGAGGTVGEDFQRIADLATRLGDRLPGTTADFQNMMTMLRRQGMSSASILGGLGEATAYLGVQLKMPATAAAEFAAKMQDATRTTEADMMGLMDVIQRTFYIGVDSGNMLQGFTKLSPVLGIIKKEGLEASKMLAPLLVMMDQTGMAGESAGNALRKVFQSGLDTKKLSDANDALKAAGKGFSLDFSDGKGEFGGLDNLFAQLDKLNQLNSMQRTTVLKKLFGDDAETLQVVATLMSKGMAGYQEVVGKMNNQADLQTRVNEQLNTLQNVAEAAQGSFTNALAEVGATVAPQLKDLLNALGDVASGVGAWVRENPAVARAAVLVVAGVAALATVFGTLALAIGAVLGPLAFSRFLLTAVGVRVPVAGRALGMLGTALRAVGTAAMWMGRAMLANPILLGVAAIAGAAYLIYTYWGPITAFFGALWQRVRAAFDAAMGWIRSLLASSDPLAMLGAAWRGLARFYADLWAGIWAGIRAALDGIGALLQGWSPLTALSAAWRAVAGFIADTWASISTAAAGGIGSITAALANWSPLGVLYQAFTSALSALGIDMPARFSELGGMLMQGLINGVTNMAGAVQATISNMGGEVVTWFKDKLGIRSPSRVMMEMGGYVSEGAAVGIARRQPAAIQAAQALAMSVTMGATPTPVPAALAASGALGGPSPAIGQPDTGAPRFDTRQPVRAVPPAAPSITIQGDTITLHLTVQGGNPQDIARAVQDALRQRDIEKSARVRSTLRDND
ncbi:phage tail protein [Bordetella ansorpii]|uniref:Phage tail protein n=1 Tax=Bordetella ansorpii TaxID=288768 RepID=A0A157QPQ4_9BORD|nr:phage tail tape measure protein [Bordetella ansorpii]SAI47534.1 phage tail protein [Bordetella ansorpii]